MNSKLILEIYENEVYETSWIREESNQSELQVARAMEKLAVEPERQEEVRGWLYDIMIVAQEGGFVAGFRYAVNLLAECMMAGGENQNR